MGIIKTQKSDSAYSRFGNSNHHRGPLLFLDRPIVPHPEITNSINPDYFDRRLPLFGKNM